eukprot:11748122-Karenia_brevis.AAC.1
MPIEFTTTTTTTVTTLTTSSASTTTITRQEALMNSLVQSLMRAPSGVCMDPHEIPHAWALGPDSPNRNF